jgi:hypothetical protein
MPTAQDYATIGHLYEAIRANLVALDGQLGSDILFLGDVAAQVDRAVIDLDGISPITGLSSAEAAIDVVIEQGEGSRAEHEDSHYYSFLGIRDELTELLREDPEFQPAWPVADSPVLRRPAEPNGTVFVDHPQAAALLDFACATYGLLLRCLVQCFGRSGANREREQQRLMSAAIALMHVLGDASSQLARLPASAADHAAHAGMTFTMLRGVEPLLPGGAERRLLLERAADLVRAGERIMPQIACGLHKAHEALAEL